MIPLPPPALVQPQPWRSYDNARFGYTLEFPAEMTEAEPPSENGDGRVFRSPDGAELRVWGGWELEGEIDLDWAWRTTSKELAKKGIAPAYRHRGREGWELSWREGDRIFYECRRIHVEEGSRVLIGFILSYRDAGAWDPRVARIRKSFR